MLLFVVLHTSHQEICPRVKTASDQDSNTDCLATCLFSLSCMFQILMEISLYVNETCTEGIWFSCLVVTNENKVAIKVIFIAYLKGTLN